MLRLNLGTGMLYAGNGGPLPAMPNFGTDGYCEASVAVVLSAPSICSYVIV